MMRVRNLPKTSNAEVVSGRGRQENIIYIRVISGSRNPERNPEPGPKPGFSNSQPGNRPETRKPGPGRPGPEKPGPLPSPD